MKQPTSPASKIGARILELASREQGFHSSDMPERPACNITTRCSILVRSGLLHRAVIRHKHVRFFTCPLAAAKAQSDAQKRRRPLPSTPTALRAHAQWGPNAQVVVTPQTKFTACPGYQPRFEAITTPFVHTANQSGRVTNC